MEKGRVKLWINKEIQLAFILYIFLFLTVSGLIIGSITFHTIWSQLIKTSPISEMRDISNLYHATFRHSLIQIVGFTFFLSLLGSLGVLLISHRIAGPAYRIETMLKSLQEGKEPVFTIRKNDALGTIAQELKTFASSHLQIVNAGIYLLDIWKKTYVQDMSLNLALKKFETSLHSKSFGKEESLP
jgi:hypothetical protein